MHDRAPYAEDSKISNLTCPHILLSNIHTLFYMDIHRQPFVSYVLFGIARNIPDIFVLLFNYFKRILRNFTEYTFYQYKISFINLIHPLYQFHHLVLETNRIYQPHICNISIYQLAFLMLHVPAHRSQVLLTLSFPAMLLLFHWLILLFHLSPTKYIQGNFHDLR